LKLRRIFIDAGEVGSFRDEADFESAAGSSAVLMMSNGRPSLVWNSWVPTSLWTAIRGQARVVSRDLRTSVASGEIYVAESATRMTFQSYGTAGSSMLGILIPQTALAQWASSSLGLTPDDPIVFPALIRRDSALHVPLLRLAHTAVREGESDPVVAALLQEVVIQMLRRQADLNPYIERCPGRTMRYQRQVFLRLIRARNHIALAGGVDASLNRLADIARMSPTHFLRTYRATFGQTPHKHVLRTRMFAAHDMISKSDLGISEICRTLGFENRCAFARVFKQQFGVSPTELRTRSAIKSPAVAMLTPARTPLGSAQDLPTSRSVS
jgi:AraC family transcriptional regulator